MMYGARTSMADTCDAELGLWKEILESASTGIKSYFSCNII